MSRRIGDYALVGDCETAGLISRDGSVDWLCWPAFDSEPCFAALVGQPQNGRWVLAPCETPAATTRRYLPETLVLETRHQCAGGEVVVVDFMPFRGEASDLIRIVSCERGEVEMRFDLSLRFDYGRLPPWLKWRDGVVTAIAGPHGARLASDIPLQRRDGSCVAEFKLKAGDGAAFALTYFESHKPQPRPVDPHRALESTLKQWRDWSAQCRYEGPRREGVVRSLITLKALTYRPTGGVVAAPTSSVPETPGGRRNWDYRFCWLRDATFTLMTLMQAGYSAEAAAWRDWLVRAVAGAPEDLRPVYGLSAQRLHNEWEASWLDGMGGAKPVRFGNAAARQKQLDIYGEVVDALYQAELHGVSSEPPERNLVVALVEDVERSWRKPDDGIWEFRGEPQCFTHSHVLAWVAVDRGIRLAKQLGLDAPLERWTSLLQEMHADICRRCFNTELGAFTQAAGSTALDAATLLIPHVGFLPATDPRMVGTVEAIERDLMTDGFVRRYDSGDSNDGLEGDEPTFLACSFWYADNLVMQGRRDEAVQLFERLVATANDVGLLSEEYSPAQKLLTGNFPQALSHLSLVNTAFNLAGTGPAQRRARRDERVTEDAC